MKILVVDVGGSHVKCLCTGHKTPRKFESGAQMTPDEMVEGVLKITRGWRYTAVSIGFPGVVRDGEAVKEPHNLGPGWVGFDFEAAFSRPVRIINDAAMQALGAYERGTMLFLGLGTGLGSALVVDGRVAAMELGHLRYARKRTYEDHLGQRGLERQGEKKWRLKVNEVVEGFRLALLPDDVVLGGGNVRKLKRMPPGARRGGNADAFRGGFRLWEAKED
ncbi:MAG: ROK family protein [Usitatibacter sp.]